MGLVTLQEEAWENLLPLCSPAPRGDHEEMAVCKLGREISTRNQLASTLSLDFPASRTVKNTILFLAHLVYGLLTTPQARTEPNLIDANIQAFSPVVGLALPQPDKLPRWRP